MGTRESSSLGLLLAGTGWGWGWLCDLMPGTEARWQWPSRQLQILTSSWQPACSFLRSSDDIKGILFCAFSSSLSLGRHQESIYTKSNQEVRASVLTFTADLTALICKMNWFIFLPCLCPICTSSEEYLSTRQLHEMARIKNRKNHQRWAKICPNKYRILLLEKPGVRFWAWVSPWAYTGLVCFRACLNLLLVFNNVGAKGTARRWGKSCPGSSFYICP